MPVSFDIKGKENCNIEVQLNKKDNNDFKKIKKEYKDINLEEVSHVDFKIKESRFPKRLRIIISNFSKDNQFTISNIELRGGKLKISDLEGFEVKGADKIILNNELRLKPQGNNIVITYPKTMNIRCAIVFDFKLFVIITILFYLIAYKLSDYAADFNTVKGKSKIDIIFLAIFFIFLFVPMSHIKNETFSFVENRNLAVWKPFIDKSGEINFEFGKNFNEWFNDRFCLRTHFVKLNRHLKFLFASRIYSENSRFFDKKNHWAFNSDWVATTSYQNEFPQYKANIERLNEFCQKNNIKLYFLIAPPTAEVYEDEFKDATSISKVVNNGEDFANYMIANNIDYVVSPLSRLKAIKDGYPYTKGDVHWNQLGAYVAYKQLCERMKKDFPKLNVLARDDFFITKSEYSKTDFGNLTAGGIYRELGIGKRYLDTQYVNFEYKKLQDISILKSGICDEITEYPYSLNPQTVYLLGNSYEECLSDFIFPMFRKVVKRRYNLVGNNKLVFSEFEDDIRK